jgi:uncharacterized protein
MKFGLSESDISYIIDSISRFNNINKAVMFGSRAKGTYKPGSDVDIALFGSEIDFETTSRLHAILEDKSPMPYRFDIVDYTHLEKRTERSYRSDRTDSL